MRTIAGIKVFTHLFQQYHDWLVLDVGVDNLLREMAEAPPETNLDNRAGLRKLYPALVVAERQS